MKKLLYILTLSFIPLIGFSQYDSTNSSTLTSTFELCQTDIDAGANDTICSDSTLQVIATIPLYLDSMQWYSFGGSTFGADDNDTTDYDASATAITNGGDTLTFTPYFKGDSVNYFRYIIINICP